MNGNSKNLTSEFSLLKVFYEGRWIIVSLTAISLAISLAIAFLSTKIYAAEVVLAPANQQQGQAGISRLLRGLGGISSVAGLRGAATETSVSLATLSSEYFTSLFIKQNNLLPILFSEKWDNEKKTWNVEDPEDIPTLSDGYELFSKTIREITEDDDTGLVTFTIKWNDPVIAADWATKSIQLVNERRRADAIREADQAVEYLYKELEKTSVVELQNAIYFMIEDQIQTRTMANVQKDYAFRVISPALPSDMDRFVFPNRPLFIALGLLVGFFVGLFAAYLAYEIRTLRTAQVKNYSDHHGSGA